MNVVKTMNGTVGRSARVVAGVALIGVGLATGGAGGTALVIIGAVALLAGAARVCLAAPLLHAPLRAR